MDLQLARRPSGVHSPLARSPFNWINDSPDLWAVHFFYLHVRYYQTQNTTSVFYAVKYAHANLRRSKVSICNEVTNGKMFQIPYKDPFNEVIPRKEWRG